MIIIAAIFFVCMFSYGMFCEFRHKRNLTRMAKDVEARNGRD